MKRQIRSHRRKVINRPKMMLFWGLVASSFVALVAYRLLFQFPVWFDEIVAKAFIFGLPFLIYALIARQSQDDSGLSVKRLWPGAYLGLALGGSFGFVAMLAASLKGGSILIPNLFAASDFWWTFALALATAWWESVFFFGLVLGVLQRVCKNEWQAALYTMLIFVAFHAPVILIHGSVSSALVPLLLLACFAFGQAVMFMRFKSLIAMVVSHAFWGMALLVYTLR